MACRSPPSTITTAALRIAAEHRRSSTYKDMPPRPAYDAGERTAATRCWIMPQGSTPDLSSGQSPTDLRAAILDAALAIAEEKGQWSAVRLHDVAGRLQISPSQVLDHYRDLDSVADAWFLRALKAMVAPKPADFMRE